MVSEGIVVRLNLPNMAYPSAARYAAFIGYYAHLNDEDITPYRERYLAEAGETMRLAQILRDAGRQQGIQQPIQQGELAAPAGIVSMTDDLFACGTVENGRDQCWLREGWAAIGKTNLEVVHVVCKMLDELAPCKDGVRYNDLFREV